MIGIDLFSGCGGMSTGAILAGIDVKYAVELDPSSAQTYSINHPDVVMFNIDVKKFHPQHLIIPKKQPFVLFGGPPCQGFSKSNLKTRNFDNNNNWLFKEFIRVAKELKPTWIVFENVGGFSETLEGYFFNKTISNFVKLGYKISPFILDASNYGVPQKRKRVFIVCSLDGISLKEPERMENKVSVGDALNDLPKLKNGDKFHTLNYDKSSTSPYSKMMRKKLKKSTNHYVTLNSIDVIKRYQYVPQGGNWKNIPSRLMKNYKDVSRCHSGIYYRLDESEPSIVIGNYRKNMLIHPTEDRGLSVREAARLQSFSDGYIFKGSLIEQQQQVGNAVPPYLAKAVFTAINEIFRR